MSHIQMIREEAKKGKSYKEICENTHSDYRTVKKYIEQDDFNEQVPIGKDRPSKLDPYKEEIQQLLGENAKNWYKQRLTGMRIQMLLKERYCEFDVSYPIVQRFVRSCKQQLQLDQQVGYDRLTWHPGEAQADFGEADFKEPDGSLRRYKYFVLSFPFSNKAYCQLYLGENCECVCQALINLFTYLGGVPSVIVFDNATGIGRRVSKILQEHRLFTQFRLHYRFSSRFCNPASGNEKGNVESNVGYIRRNMFVPILNIPNDVEQFNRTKLIEACESLMSLRNHYIHKIPVNELFEKDQAALVELPAKPFIARRVIEKKTNGYGEVVLEKNHRYALESEYGNTTVLVETYPWHVRVYSLEGKLLESFVREYGQDITDSINMKTCISNVLKKPNSWKNSMLREKLGHQNPLCEYLDSLNHIKDLKKTLYRFHQAMEGFNYDTVLYAFQELIKRGSDVTNESNIQVYCNRIETLDPYSSENVTGVNLDKYNVLLGETTLPTRGQYANQ